MKLNELKQYFQDIATHHVAIESFLYGGLKRILSRNDFPDLKFPLLFLEKPSYNFEGTPDNIQAKPRMAFVILKNSDIQNPTEQDIVEQQMFDIAMDIIGKLNKDYKERTIGFYSPNGSSLDAIDTITLDGDIGWRYEFALSQPVEICYNVLKWS